MITRGARTRRPRLESTFALGLLAIGGGIAYLSWGYGFGSLARPGPGLYPFFLGIVIVACAIAIMISPPESRDEPLFEAGGARTFLLMSATFCLWIVAMPLLGYVAVTLLATCAFAKSLGLEGWTKPLAISGGTALLVYLLFDKWLYIDLPRGILFD